MRFVRFFFFFVFLALVHQAASSQEVEEATAVEETEAVEVEVVEVEAVEPEPVVEDPLEVALSTIRSLVSLRDELRQDIQAANRQARTAQTATEKQQFLAQIEKLNGDLATTQRNIEEISAGVVLERWRNTQEPEFDFMRELYALLEPAISEMKEMTSHVRERSDLREKIELYRSRVPVTEGAIAKLETLLAESDDGEVKAVLDELLTSWRKQDTFLQTELQSAEVQLAQLEAAEQSLTEVSSSYLKEFFENRGRYIGESLLLVLVIMLASRITMRTLQRFVPGFQKANRSFGIRLIDLSIRVLTAIATIVGPMIVFYLAQDWLLFSLSLLLLLGIALGLRQAIPRYWRQVQLFLNVGTVREGERLEYGGLPWLVKQINVYTMLENPATGFKQRLKIDDLVDLRSRPLHRNEPWFPCRMGDWVLFENRTRAKVVSLSHELVQFVERGGAHKTMTTAEFLETTVINLSVNFRIKETIGISYSLQKESVTSIPAALREHVARRLNEEGYGEQILNLQVEFESANTSSLDMVVIADFSGELAEVYNRMRRSIQRYCVEACTANGWEIPFTQITLHEG